VAVANSYGSSEATVSLSVLKRGGICRVGLPSLSALDLHTCQRCFVALSTGELGKSQGFALKQLHVKPWESLHTKYLKITYECPRHSNFLKAFYCEDPPELLPRIDSVAR
jgi:hypothetical protein